jgi:hypothetical protein
LNSTQAPLLRISIKSPGFSINEEWAEKLLKCIEDSSQNFGELLENYNEKNLDLKNHLCYDVLVEKETMQIVSGCGIYNGGRYPEGVYRVLNRSFITPKFRKKGLFLPLNSINLLPYQIEDSRRFLKLIFVSRQGLKGKNFLESWTKKFPLGNYSGKWIVSEDLVKVSPKSKFQSGFQYIAKYSFSDVEWSPQTVGISDWKKIPRN